MQTDNEGRLDIVDSPDRGIVARPDRNVVELLSSTSYLRRGHNACVCKRVGGTFSNSLLGA